MEIASILVLLALSIPVVVLVTATSDVVVTEPGAEILAVDPHRIDRPTIATSRSPAATRVGCIAVTHRAKVLCHIKV